jgi:hypothetical protein
VHDFVGDRSVDEVAGGEGGAHHFVEVHGMGCYAADLRPRRGPSGAVLV